MALPERTCFVIMPYLPALHYFYLYLKGHVEHRHGLVCERADARVLTQPILDKITDAIRNADVLIADCSGRNPNVFYELGLAHAFGKPVVLLTSDEVNEAPSDVRHFEFIRYRLDQHVEFLDRLDNALHNVFAERYEPYYAVAQKVFREFCGTTGSQLPMVDKQIFVQRVIEAERVSGLPDLHDSKKLAKFVLPRIAQSGDADVMRKLLDWLEER